MMQVRKVTSQHKRVAADLLVQAARLEMRFHLTFSEEELDVIRTALYGFSLGVAPERIFER